MLATWRSARRVTVRGRRTRRRRWRKAERVLWASLAPLAPPPRLTCMATIAIGDIHGNLPALDDLVDQVAPDLSAADTVVFLGDYIDRGPASKDCVDRILDF